MVSNSWSGRAFRSLAAALASLALAVSTGAAPALADDTVSVPDATLRNCISAHLEQAGLSPDFTSANLEGLSKLECYSRGIGDLTGAEHLSGLTTLIAYGSTVSDLRPITGLPLLWNLQVPSTQSYDLAPIESLPSLTKLMVSLQQDTNAGPIGRLGRLERLYLDNGRTRLAGVTVPAGVKELVVSGGSRLADLSGISGGAGVRKLTISGSSLTSLDGLEGLTSVEDLTCAGTDLNDLSAVTGMTGLTRLYLANDDLSDLAPLRGLTRLAHLDLSANRVGDLTSLGGLTGLEELRLQRNQVTDVSPLATLAGLTLIDLSSNNVTTLAPLAGLPALTSLSAQENQLTDLGPDGGLVHLISANFVGNRITSVAALRGAPLRSLDLMQNQVFDLSPLSGIDPAASVRLRENRVKDLSPLPDTIDLVAGAQTVSFVSPVTAGQPIDLGIRDIAGRAVCPRFNPSAPCVDGVVTYPRSGTFTGSVSSDDNTGLALSFTQHAGPDRQFTRAFAPKLHGWPRVGTSLVTETKAWTPKVDHFTYQWYRDGKLITGPESDGYHYLATAADRGHRLSACVTGHLDGFTATRLCSARTAKTAIGGIRDTAKPQVTGKPITDSVLTAVPGTWDPGVSFTYQWQRSGRNIKGHTDATFTVRSRDVGDSIRVRVTGTKPGFRSATRYSASFTPKRASLVAASPAISGAALAGTVLTAVPGGWTPAPVSFGYQWYWNGMAIKKATTATYRLTTVDLGRTIKVKVIGRKVGYHTAVRYSAATAVVS